MAVVAVNNLECHQLDVNNAFTQAHLTYDIYMSAPSGYNIRPNRVLKVSRSLYGLKQAARDWYDNFRKTMIDVLGFTRSNADPCIYVHLKRNMIVGLYVDDMVVAVKLLGNVQWFKHIVAQQYKIKDLREIQRVLSIRVRRDRKNKEILLDQESYLEKMLEKYKMAVDTLKGQKVSLSGYEGITAPTEKDVSVDTSQYQEMCGSVMHPVVYTRPDCAFAISKLSQWMTRPTIRHILALKGLIRYLRQTKDYAIRFSASVNYTKLTGYADADFAIDKTDRKSTYGVIFFLAGGAVSWSSKKQHSVSTSTTEAEYIALSHAAKQAQWCSQFLREIGYPDMVGSTPYTVQLYGDNTGSLDLVKNARINDRSKHIDVAYHNTKDFVSRGRLTVSYISTNDMIADGLTKPLAGVKHQDFIYRLNMDTAVERSLWGSVRNQAYSTVGRALGALSLKGIA